MTGVAGRGRGRVFLFEYGPDVKVEGGYGRRDVSSVSMSCRAADSCGTDPTSASF